MRNTSRRLLDRFHYCIDELIEINHYNRLLHAKQKEIMSYGEWLLEFATVRINIGRQTGKTEYIKENFDPNSDIIITRNLNMKHIYNFEKVYTFPEIYNLGFPLPFEKPEVIWIDEASLSNKELSIITNALGCKAFDQTIIIFGE